MRIRKLWQRLKYRKQLKQGFGLLEDRPVELLLVDGRDFTKRLIDDKETIHIVNKKYDWDEVTTINVYEHKDV